MNPRGFLLGTVLAVAVIAGCDKKVSDRDLVRIDAEKALEKARGRDGVLGVGATKPAVWIDPRSPAKFAAGHIEGAINMPFATVEDDHELLKDYPVLIVYGEDYGDFVAEAMAKKLLALKHKDVLLLHGGLKAWKAAGHAVVTGGGP